MKKTKSLLLFFLSISTFVYSGVLEFEGFYNGKNLFVENSFLKGSKSQCITNIYVNSKHLLSQPEGSVVEIDLSSFKKGDSLRFRIYHKNKCVPVIINKKDIEKASNYFSFTTLKINENKIYWETKGEESIGKFSVQQFVNNDWRDLKSVKASGMLSVNVYSTASRHLSGLNKYRVKYRSSGGMVSYSDVVEFESSKTPVVFYPKRVVDFITFQSEDSRKVEFAVHDVLGKLLFEGEGILIDCRNLREGHYYVLKYENKEERFYKK